MDAQYEQYKRTARLIAGEIRGSLNPDEKETLASWIRESEANRQLYEKIRNSDNFRDWQELTGEINVGECWDEFYPRMRRQEKKLFYLNLLKYAAMLVIPLAVAGALRMVMERPSPFPEPLQDQTAQITPGANKAILILDNGKTVSLDSNEEKVLKEKDGTTIQKAAGQLNYSAAAVRSKAEEPIFNTIRIPRGGEYNLVLSDGTRVWLNAMSEFKYPVRFTGNTRQVELTGEAYFEVSHSGKPFIVLANQARIRVLGTCFNVNAYENTGKVVTTLVKGSVMVAAKDGQKKSYILTPDQQAVFGVSDSTWQVKTVDINLYTAWKNGEFIFFDNPLEEIMSTLGRWYSVDVAWEDPELKKIRFSGSLDKYNNLNEMLEIMEATNKVKIEINNKTIIFKQV